MITLFLFALLYHTPSPPPDGPTHHIPETVAKNSDNLCHHGEKASPTFNLTTSERRTQRFPACIVIGVQKAGARTLLNFLNIHPDIVAIYAESHFFDVDEKYIRGVEYYRETMPFLPPHQVTVENSAHYFITPTVSERIWKMIGCMKLIVVVREPVQRMISEYLHFQQRREHHKLPFEVIGIRVVKAS